MSASATSTSRCWDDHCAPTEHVTGAIGYVRLHGRNYEQWFDSDNRNDRYNYLYSEKELAGWKERIESVAQRAQTTYVITNNHFESKAGVNALELKAMISSKRVLAPPTLIQKYPELRRFAESAVDKTAAKIQADSCPCSPESDLVRALRGCSARSHHLNVVSRRDARRICRGRGKGARLNARRVWIAGKDF